MRLLWVLALASLLLPAATAQEAQPGPGVVLLVHHPDDGVDPLGFPFGGAQDAFLARHGHFEVFSDTIAYPGFVADGRVPYEGLPATEGDALDETFALYDAVVTMRHGQEPAATLTVNAARAGDAWNVTVTIETSTDLGDGVRLWTALVEDPVHYRPPTGLTNGVFDHPFTVRAVVEHGLAEPGTRNLTLTPDPAWSEPNLRLAVWVQQTAQDGRFDAREVVQATMHDLTSDTPTRQESRGVLIEGYSATWCEPCLVGDLALEHLAEKHGLSPARAEDEGPTYFHAPPVWVLLLAAGAFALFAAVRWPEAR